MISSFTQLEQSVVNRAHEQLQEPGITKVARNSFTDQEHSYTVELAGVEVKLYMNLRKTEENAIAGSGEFKVSKIMKRVGCDEVAVRSVLKGAKAITTEALVFARINSGKGSGKQYVRHGNVFAFTRKNGDTAVACVSSYCPNKFNDLTKEQKKAAMKAIALGLEYLHNNGIVHCDINGKNILMNENGPVIIDLEGALLFDQTTGTLDAEFLHRRTEKRPCFFHNCAPPDTRKAVGAAFDTLTFDRAKKWDIFAFGLLVNYAYNLGITVESTNKSSNPNKQGYEESIDEIPDCDYEVYKAPAVIADQDKAIVSIALKCLQGHPLTWPEIHHALI